MTQNVITSKSVVPRVLVFGIIISISVVYLKNRYPVPIDQAVAGSRESAELSNPDLRLWRVHLLLR
jgi:hypothetical protein